MTAHVSAQKKQDAQEVETLLAEYPIVAAINVESLPAKQLQTMREKLRGTCHIRMAKRRVMMKAIEAAKIKRKGIEALEPHMEGMSALLFTKENPFTLYKTIKKNKSKAAAKAGQRAPREIIVPAGPTSFAPGPIIGELGSVGIKAGVEAGKIAIKQDAVVAKEGDIISAKLAGILLRLGIEPMEIGLDVRAVYEDGMIMTRSVLDVDEDMYLGMIVKAASEAIELSIESGFLTPDSRERAIQRSVRGATALAIELKQSPETGLSLSEAESALYNTIVNGPAPAAAEEASTAPVKEDKKEEKKEEAAAEGLGSLFG